MVEMEEVEDRMYDAATTSGMVTPDPEKRLEVEQPAAEKP
jgi:hypothetical protein